MNLDILDSPNSGPIGLRMGNPFPWGLNITRLQRKLNGKQEERTKNSMGTNRIIVKEWDFFQLLELTLPVTAAFDVFSKKVQFVPPQVGEDCLCDVGSSFNYKAENQCNTGSGI
jgi:hypothetical protein